MDERKNRDLLLENAERVFSEPDAAKRLRALADLWAAEGELVETDRVVAGYEPISQAVESLLRSLPQGSRFQPDGHEAGHHGIARLRWRAVDGSGAPLGVTGTDIGMLGDGRIEKLFVILD